MRISDLEFRRVLFRSAQPHQSVRPVSQAVAILIDARGLKCPWPALRLARAVRQAGGGCFDLIAEDPAAQRDIPRLAAENGQSETRRVGKEFVSPVCIRWSPYHLKNKNNTTNNIH